MLVERAWRGVISGSSQTGGVDLGIDSAEFFDHTGWGGIACAAAVLVSRSGRAGRLGRAHRALRLPTLGWAVVAVNSVALIWKLARMDILTRRDYAGMRLGEIQRIEYFLVDAVVL